MPPSVMLNIWSFPSAISMGTVTFGIAPSLYLAGRFAPLSAAPLLRIPDTTSLDFPSLNTVLNILSEYRKWLATSGIEHL